MTNQMQQIIKEKRLEYTFMANSKNIEKKIAKMMEGNYEPSLADSIRIYKEYKINKGELASILSEIYKRVLSCVTENIYSRIPVYSGTVDNIKGVLYIKDLLPHLNKGDGFRWQTLIRPAFFVPETKQIDDLLRDFQASKVHIAIVVDEFGGTLGLVTLEDVIEEIVGEINDEYDEVERSYVKLNSNTYLFEAKTMLTDFQRELDLDDELFEEVEGDADSLAGLLLELKGDFPELHESIDFHHLTFEVMEMDERRIVKIKVVVHATAPKAIDADA